MTAQKEAHRGLSDALITLLEGPARRGDGVDLELSASAARLLLRWARIMRQVERPALDELRAKKRREAMRIQRALERDAYWAGIRDRLGDLLLAYVFTGVTLWIVEAFWLAGAP